MRRGYATLRALKQQPMSNTNPIVAGKFRAGLDVYAVEPLPEADAGLRSCDNVVITPHVAYKTKEALRRRAIITSKNAMNALSGNETNRVA